MQIELKQIKVCDIINEYADLGEDGVFGLSGNLNIRPPYQREFIYKDKQRDAVIDTVRKGFPLNVLYWAVNDDDRFEVMDGQQRTLSICQYVNGDFSLNHQFFHNLTEDEREQILDYELMVYLCTGSEREKLEWFKVINIAGEKLTNQELRNAVYTGEWLMDAKRFFSKATGPAAQIGKNLLSGSPIRQDYLETALDWISEGEIEHYMAVHQRDDNANELKRYFQSVIAWADMLFPKKRAEMKSVAWGPLFNKHQGDSFDARKLEADVSRLMMDEDITKKSGIYPYLITGDEHYLSIRAFTPNQKREAYERQNGICSITGAPMDIHEMEADHIIPWSQGGKTISDNCQMVSKLANRRKSNS